MYLPRLQTYWIKVKKMRVSRKSFFSVKFRNVKVVDWGRVGEEWKGWGGFGFIFSFIKGPLIVLVRFEHD